MKGAGTTLIVIGLMVALMGGLNWLNALTAGTSVLHQIWGTLELMLAMLGLLLCAAGAWLRKN